MTGERNANKSVFSRLAKREKHARSMGEGVSALFDSLGGRERARLNLLWTGWASVMGEYIASLSHPLGHAEEALLVGADDAMAMQELSLLSQEVLERANAHMGRPFFSKVTVRLIQGRPDLARPRKSEASLSLRPPYTPERIGRHSGAFDPDSPVTRCYEAHVKAGEDI